MYRLNKTTIEFDRLSQNQKGVEDPKTNSGYKTLIYFSPQAYWRRPDFLRDHARDDVTLTATLLRCLGEVLG